MQKYEVNNTTLKRTIISKVSKNYLFFLRISVIYNVFELHPEKNSRWSEWLTLPVGKPVRVACVSVLQLNWISSTRNIVSVMEYSCGLSIFAIVVYKIARTPSGRCSDLWYTLISPQNKNSLHLPLVLYQCLFTPSVYPDWNEVQHSCCFSLCSTTLFVSFPQRK